MRLGYRAVARAGGSCWFYLSNEEAFLHVPGLDGSEKLHGFILALTGLQLLPRAQHALQQHQTHTEDYLDS